MKLRRRLGILAVHPQSFILAAAFFTRIGASVDLSYNISCPLMDAGHCISMRYDGTRRLRDVVLLQVDKKAK